MKLRLQPDGGDWVWRPLLLVAVGCLLVMACCAFCQRKLQGQTAGYPAKCWAGTDKDGADKWVDCSFASASTTIGGVTLGPDRAERVVELSDGVFLIRYQYNHEVAFMPAIQGAKIHYDAEITVLRVKRRRLVEIGRMRGTYVPDGCYEDDPKAIIEQVRKKAIR